MGEFSAIALEGVNCCIKENHGWQPQGTENGSQLIPSRKADNSVLHPKGTELCQQPVSMKKDPESQI